MPFNDSYQNEYGFDREPETGATDSPVEQGSVIEPARKMNELDSLVDKAFEDVINALDIESNTILNAVSSIRLNDVAKGIKRKTIEKQDLQTQLKDKFQNLEGNILDELQNISVPKERIKRYQVYNQIIDEVYIASRMLQVYLDNLLIKNPYTKQFLDILPSEEVENIKSVSDTDKRTLVDFTKTIMSYYKIQNKLKTDILPVQLRLGNFFVEVINLKEFEQFHKKENSIRVLTENAKITKDETLELEVDFRELLEIVDEHEQAAANPQMSFEEQVKLLFEDQFLDEQSARMYEEVAEKLTTADVIDILRSLNVLELRNIQINYISPENVIILRENGIDFGYLVIEASQERNSTGSTSYGVNGDERIDVVKRFTDLGKTVNKEKSEEAVSRKHVDEIITKIFRKIRDTRKFTKNSQILDLVQDEETKYALHNVIYDKYKKYSKVRVRYLPPDKLVNFTNPIDKYSPYGTSIFDSIVLPARLYLLGLLSSIISRLNRASVIRKWTLEVGAHRNHSEIVERFKQELRNNTISLSDITELQDITNILTDYKDVVTVQQNGKRFVDLDLLPVHDRSLPMNELDQLKRELVEATGIPSSFLNITDTVELREQIVQININFANTINSLQSYINDAMESLVDAIFHELLKNNGLNQRITLSRYVDIKLNPPLLLTLQHLEGTVSAVTNLVNLLTTMQVPTDPIWMLKRFIKIVDWEAVRTAGIEFQKSQTINQNIQATAGETLGGQSGGF